MDTCQIKEEKNTNIKTRNAGIDFARIVSILMIVVLHINGHGAIIKSTTPLTFNWYTVNLLEQMAIVGVNIFVLVSGFVNYGRKIKIKNLLVLWLEVFFYSFLITFVFRTGGYAKINFASLLKSAFPVVTRQYWYFSCYFLLFLVMPILNKLIDIATKRQATLFIIVILAFTSLFSTEFDPFYVNGGYDVLWFMLVYSIGAYIKKFGFTLFKNEKSYKYLLLYFLFVGAGLLSTVILYKLYGRGANYNYNFIFNFLSALALFKFFETLSIRDSRILSLASKTSFAVYLISDNIYVRATFISKKFAGFANDFALLMVLKILLTAVIIYVICTLIDLIRILIFKVCQINSLMDIIQRKFTRLEEKIKT